MACFTSSISGAYLNGNRQVANKLFAHRRYDKLLESEHHTKVTKAGRGKGSTFARMTATGKTARDYRQTILYKTRRIVCTVGKTTVHRAPFRISHWSRHKGPI